MHKTGHSFPLETAGLQIRLFFFLADLAQRHLKELMQRDLSQVKADVRSEEKFDFAKLHDEITELEKRVRRLHKVHTGRRKNGEICCLGNLCALDFSGACCTSA